VRGVGLSERVQNHTEDCKVFILVFARSDYSNRNQVCPISRGSKSSTKSQTRTKKHCGRSDLENSSCSGGSIAVSCMTRKQRIGGYMRGGIRSST
jgi:hypothetical protein